MLVRQYSGDDGQSHFEDLDSTYPNRGPVLWDPSVWPLQASTLALTKPTDLQHLYYGCPLGFVRLMGACS